MQDAAAILLVGVTLICVVIGMVFGITWGLLVMGLFCIFVAIVKAS